jgi:2'-5' RNA ligase
MNKSHRLFFALVPDSDVRSGIEQVQGKFLGAGRAAKPHQFHATLAFLGMQPPELIPEIRAIASRLAFEPCTVVMDGLGRFNKAGVLWLGTSRIPESLLWFQQSLVDALLEAGIGYDRVAWKFHVTLYRKMRMSSSIMDPVAIEWSLDGFDLIESVSVRSGVEYHSIGHWKAQSSGGISDDV